MEAGACSYDGPDGPLVSCVQRDSTPLFYSSEHLLMCPVQTHLALVLLWYSRMNGVMLFDWIEKSRSVVS